MPPRDAISREPAGLLPPARLDSPGDGVALALPANLAWLRGEAPGLRRLLHGHGLLKPARFAHRIMRVGWEVAGAAVLDLIRPLPTGVLREEAGHAPVSGGALCLYAHWSPDGRVSAMVRRQLGLWRAAGFDVVFVSNASVPEADWRSVGEHTVLRLTRYNAGLDFAAWRDAAARALPRFGMPEELLLANDSVLGPVRPLDPVLAAWRNGGEGLFGLTESRAGGVHLQSYALLARGARVVEFTLRHLAGMRDRRSKWRVVQQGEIALTTGALRAGIRCAAAFGYDRVVAQAGTDASAGARWPLNPTHHFWRGLVERMDFPFIKSDLVRRNPGRVAGIEEWPRLVGPAERREILDHLAMMDAA